MSEVTNSTKTIAPLCKGMKVMVYYVHGGNDIMGYEGVIVSVKKAFALRTSSSSAELDDVVLVASVKYDDGSVEDEEFKFNDFWSEDNDEDKAPEDAWRFVGNDNVNILVKNLIWDMVKNEDKKNNETEKKSVSAPVYFKAFFAWMCVFTVMFGFVVLRADNICKTLCPQTSPSAMENACNHMLAVADSAKSWWKTTATMLEKAFDTSTGGSNNSDGGAEDIDVISL